MYAVAVAQQNKDSLSQAWAEGITVLPQRESLVLILAFLPGNCHVELTVKASPTQPLAVTKYKHALAATGAAVAAETPST